MKMISEGDEEPPVREPPPKPEASMQRELRARVQKRKEKQLQITKITNTYELEKFLLTLPGYDDGMPTVNLNPGGGGRVTNRPLGGSIPMPAKKRVEPQVNDFENVEYQEHPINKAIKMTSIMNALMFKVSLKEPGPVHLELLNRCARYFGFAIPKYYKTDINGLMK